ncbi:MAG: aspartate-semialdehyde dehydrogenase [Gemmiger sp.]|uniref:aspartate-semialdehyde dehydrogenase n=1 Tax=Gemmiger sp. TaxID=2049027 RepID=UPI002E7A97A0|nr:aspartate-semialdehyde dehydrogenase [Gemmiger sp.]MEE0801797.1 aspartate-semialdehyde dehydrogenase [Gemmiger sp.]
MKQYKVGVVGATGMVGQRFVTLLENHPWFKLTALAASARSAGKTYEEAVGGRWMMQTPMPESVKKMMVMDASHVEEVASQVDFVFCAVNMKKDEIKALEEAYAKAECPVVSNNSANRFTPDVPMVVPEINADHIEIIPAQRRRLGTKRGFIAVKSNCSLQSYVPALHPLMKDYGVTKCLVCTYQAISGAGKTFETFPEILDNVIPYISGEEEKSEQEPLKLWGHIEGDRIVSADSPSITAQCLRVPVLDGHMGAVFVSFAKKPTKEEILKAWKEFRGPAQELNLPSAPKQFLHYFEENDRPQPKLDRMLENGMAVSIGRLREDTQYDYKFVCLSHNTLRGAAGGGVLLAELLAAKGYFD